MIYLQLVLGIAFVACLWLGVPALLVARAKKPNLPWWVVVVSAVVIGWIAANGNVLVQHLAIDETRRLEELCFSNPSPVKPHEVIAADGTSETVVDNPCGIGEWIVPRYEPTKGLLYGPLYLLVCSLPYWLIMARRSAPGLTRQIVWLAAATFLVEWTAITSFLARGSHFGEGYEMDPYIWPPLTVPVALFTAWLVVTQLIQRFDHTRAAKRSDDRVQ